MSVPRVGPGRFRWPWRSRSQVEAELEEEVRFHVDMRTERLMRSGMRESDARARALAEFGDSTELRRELMASETGLERRRRWFQAMEDLRQDVWFALRRLRKNPGFAAVAIGTLALGIGAAVAMFTVVNSVALRPLPYADPDRLVVLLPGQNANMALADAVGESPAIEASSGISIWGMVLTGQGDAAHLQAQLVDSEFFDVLGVQPMLGRPFRPEERDPARSDVVVISHSLWQGRFGGDPDVIGRRVELSGSGHDTREVIGVMPPGFQAPLAPFPIELWAPLSREAARTFATDSTWYVNWVVGRLAPGATVEAASRDVRRVMAGLRAEYGSLVDEEQVRTAGATHMLDFVVGDVRPTLLILLAAVGLVLLLACANLANLLLARGEGRRQETAMRAAIGGTRGRLLRELLTESLVLAVLGGAAGVALAWGLLRTLRVAEISGLPRAATLSIDPAVLGVALALSLGSVVAFGLLPALRLTGDLRPELGSGGRTRGRTRRGRLLGGSLITVEVALAMVLVTGAGLLLSSLRQLREVEPGIDTGDVLAVEIAPPSHTYDGERVDLLHDEVRARLAALPGVRSVGAIHLLPFTDSNWSFPYLAEGHAPPADGPLPSANFRVVTPGYFESVDVPLLAGRGVQETDGAGTEKVMVINRTLAEKLWPGEEAVGRTIRLFGSEPWRVVGVVGDAHQEALDVAVRPEMYVPSKQFRVAATTFMIETSADPGDLAPAAQAAIRDLDPDVPVLAARPLDDVLGDSMRQRRFFASVLTFFGMLALALGAVGIYGVMSYSVRSRIPEFGIRMALGAHPGEVVRGAVSSGIPHVAIGLAAGLAGALAATRLLSGLLFGVEPRDPLTLAAAAVVLGAVALLASWIPARRLTRLDPANVLRGE